MGATLHRGARASHYRGLSCCGAQAPDAQAQQLWLTGLVAPWHVGSSQTRARTRVPCIGRQTLKHCATREALIYIFFKELEDKLQFGYQKKKKKNQETQNYIIYSIRAARAILLENKSDCVTSLLKILP